MTIGKKLSNLISTFITYVYLLGKENRIKTKLEETRALIHNYRQIRNQVEMIRQECSRLLYRVQESIQNTKVPEINEKFINYLLQQNRELQEYTLRLHEENRRLMVENKRLLNELTLRKVPFPEIVSEIKTPLVVTEDNQKLANTFPYSEEEKRIILTLFVKPVSINEIVTNAATTKNKVKKFILQIYRNGNRVANRFGEVFKLVGYKEGRSKETKYMLLPAEVPTAEGAEKLPVEELM